jgi:hypothetical protein
MLIITLCQGKLNAVFLDPDGLIVHRFGFIIGFSDIECQNGFLVMMDFSGFCGLPAMHQELDLSINAITTP